MRKNAHDVNDLRSSFLRTSLRYLTRAADGSPSMYLMDAIRALTATDSGYTLRSLLELFPAIPNL